MENRKTFTYNGVNSADYGLYISGDSVYNAPSRVYEMVDIAGRNGQLAIDQGRFENIEVTYPAFIFAETQTEFAQRLRDIRAWLMSPVGYQRLEDTYHPDEFRMAIYMSGLEADPTHYNEAGEFELTFNCKPQRFLKSGEEEITITSGDELDNPSPFEALPLIEVVGVGSLTVGNITVTITGESTQDIFIDSDIMEAYEDDNGAIISRNDRISLSGMNFPTLGTDTGITYTGLTSVTVTPRWWTI